MTYELTIQVVEARFASLTAARARWFALACAERRALADPLGRTGELHSALDVAWEAVETGVGTTAAALATLHEAREDADDDAVAATIFALRAAAEDDEAAHRALWRCLDAAFDAVPYPHDAAQFRSLDGDVVSEVVQAEVNWLLIATDRVTEALNSSAVKAWIRP